MIWKTVLYSKGEEQKSGASSRTIVVTFIFEAHVYIYIRILYDIPCNTCHKYPESKEYNNVHNDKLLYHLMNNIVPVVCNINNHYKLKQVQYEHAQCIQSFHMQSSLFVQFYHDHVILYAMIM